MVLDNFDDPEALDEWKETPLFAEDRIPGDSKPLSRYIPQGSNGSMLITSRNRNAAYYLTNDESTIINVPYMTLKEAKSLLDKKLPNNCSSQEEKSKLVELLDCVPLAITQAAAFISRRQKLGWTILRYSEDIQSHDEILFREIPDLRRDHEVPHSVIRTWYKSFYQISKESYAAADLFSRMCIFDRQGIPKFLVSDQYINDSFFEDALAPLVDYSLISLETNCTNFAIHRLIQFAMTKWLESQTWLGSQDLIDKYREDAVELLKKCFPKRGLDNAEHWKCVKCFCLTFKPFVNSVFLIINSNCSKQIFIPTQRNTSKKEEDTMRPVSSSIERSRLSDLYLARTILRPGTPRSLLEA